LQVQDANGCEYQTVFEIVEPEPFIVQLGPDTTIHLGNTVIITLEDITADPERIVQLNTIPSGLIFPDTLTPVYSFRYQVEVVDSNGCKARDDRFIIVDRERWVYIPNVFAPNSSTNNVVMVFGGEDVERVLSFRVFDRWGEALYEVTDFQPNDPDTGWGGQYKGQDLPPAVFVYYAEILFKDGETQVFKGDVTLIR
jgi:gliding motility-associated-like protein